MGVGRPEPAKDCAKKEIRFVGLRKRDCLFFGGFLPFTTVYQNDARGFLPNL